MGFPHPTVDLPGDHPGLVAELRSLALDPDGWGAALRTAAAGGDAVPGHLCATAWVFSSDRHQVLLVRHRRLGWSTPGGHVERGETSQHAATRELWEETGLDVAGLRAVLDGPALVHVTDVDGERPHRHWNVGWLYAGDPATPLDPSHGATWFAIDDLPSPAPDDLTPTVQHLRSLLERTE